MVGSDTGRVDETRFRWLVENASDLITVVGLDLKIVFVPDSAARFLGYRTEQLEGSKFSALVDPSGLSDLRAACAAAADGIAPGAVQLRLRRQDGGWVDGETVVRYDSEEGLLVLATRDVSKRRGAEQQVRRQAAQLAVVARLGARALAGEDLPELMRQATAVVASALGADDARVHEYQPDAQLFSLFAGVGSEELGRAVDILAVNGSLAGHTLTTGSPVLIDDWTTEARFDESSSLTAHGVASSISVVIPGTAAPFGVMTVYARQPKRFNYNDGVFLRAVANILAAPIVRSQSEQKIRHQALHDALTRLPNRALFEDRAALALASARRHGRRVAVLFLDLDDFKRVNDGLGHAVGDELLCSVAKRLSACVREEDTVARIGGDEFVILLPEIADEGDAIAAAERVGEQLRVPLSSNGRQLTTRASVGIAIGGTGAADEDAQTLVRDADLAMYAAKQRGRGGWEIFAQHMYETALQRLDLTGDLHHIVEREELEVHYQPIVSLDDEAIVGMEALVRWDHPRHGLLPPAAFIPLAEETGLIVPLGRAVMRTACESLRRWQLAQPRHHDLYISVNVSAHEFRAPDLASAVRAILTETSVSPSTLVLEITETVLLECDEQMLRQLRELKDLGVRLAVDDFGTGYSALGYLQSFPLDIVKIDKTFVDGLGENAERDRLVKGVIDLAHGMRLQTVAEGIENPAQIAALRGMESELGQGYHFARPLSRADATAVINSGPLSDPAGHMSPKDMVGAQPATPAKG